MIYIEIGLRNNNIIVKSKECIALVSILRSFCALFWFLTNKLISHWPGLDIVMSGRQKKNLKNVNSVSASYN